MVCKLKLINKLKKFDYLLSLINYKIKNSKEKTIKKRNFQVNNDN